ALQGGQVFSLSPRAYLWAALAGLCAGSGEITYFYLLSGVGFARPMAASIVIPAVVSGPILIAPLFPAFVLREKAAWTRDVGGLLIGLGIVTVFSGSTGS